MQIKNFVSAAKIIILGLVFSIGIGFVFAEWQGPSEPPLSGNVERPINVGTDLQTKAGSFWANFLGSSGAGYFAGNVEVGSNLQTNTLRITGNSPQAGKYLEAADASGNVTWATFPAIIISCTENAQAGIGSAIAFCQNDELLTSVGGECDGDAGIFSVGPIGGNQGQVMCVDASVQATASVSCCSFNFEI